ncbi:MAG: hypothetical protein H0T73_04910 [Ardenticatenales bacterium]|nr:hypothetical protein [Ardenticatenales bacterium]
MDWVALALKDPECARQAARDDHHELMIEAKARCDANFFGARIELTRAVRGYLCYLATSIAKGWLARLDTEENIREWISLYGFESPIDPFLGVEVSFAPLPAPAPQPAYHQPTWGREDAERTTRRTAPWSSPAYAFQSTLQSSSEERQPWVLRR